MLSDLDRLLIQSITRAQDFSYRSKQKPRSGWLKTKAAEAWIDAEAVFRSWQTSYIAVPSTEKPPRGPTGPDMPRGRGSEVLMYGDSYRGIMTGLAQAKHGLTTRAYIVLGRLKVQEQLEQKHAEALREDPDVIAVPSTEKPTEQHKPQPF